MTTGGSNELMQEGIRQVREGRTAEAYNAFRQVVSREPDNEFAWIWISVTSDNRDEKRDALNQALRVNPNSQRAREALRMLDAEESKAGVAAATFAPVPAAYASPTPPFQAGPAPRIGAAEAGTPLYNQGAQGDPLRAALNDNPKGKKQKTPKPPKIKAVPTMQNEQGIRQRPPRRNSGRGFGLALVFILAIVATLLIVYLLLQNQSSPNPVAEQTAATSPGATTDGTTTTTAAVNTTASAATTVSGVATVTANAAGTVTSASTTGAATTPQAGTTITTTLAATSPGAATTTTSATTASSTIGPAQVAAALQTARASQATGDYRAALTAYETALKAAPRDVQANLGVGSLYLAAPASALPGSVDRYAEAVKAFRVVTGQAPNWSGGHARLGEALAAQGSTKDAIAAFIKSLELDPNGPERWLALAALYDKDGQPEQAKFARERATSLNAPPAPPTTAAPTTAAPTTAAPGPTPTVRR